MTLTELRYIVTLAQEQHFGRAAERCHVSQPTLSVAVKKLEEELGVALFERSKTRVSPTPMGEKVVAQSQNVLEQASAIKDIASSGKDQLTGPLKVGAIFTIGPYLFPHFIPKLQTFAPGMPLYVEESYTATLRQRLRKGELDVIIISLPFTEADVVTQTLEGSSLETMRHMVASGMGVTILPQSAAISPYAPDTLVIKPLADKHAKREVALAWRASFPRHKAIDVLRKAILTSQQHVG